MPETRRLLIMNAAVAALDVAAIGTTLRPNGLTVHRLRQRPIEEEELPALVLGIIGLDPPVEEASGAWIQTLHIGIEGRAKVQHGVPADDVIDELATWLEIALWDDETLGGLATQMSMEEQLWGVDDEVDRYARLGVTVSVQFVTVRGDPRVAA